MKTMNDDKNWSDDHYDDDYGWQEQFPAEPAAPGRSGRKKKGRAKLWISLCAVTTALIVGAIAVISVSASNAETADDKDTVFLTTSDSSQKDADVALTGYVLTDVSDVVQDVLPSVVSITSRTLANYYGNSGFFGNGDMGNFGDLFEQFFGDSFGGPGGNYYYYEQGPNGTFESNGSEGIQGNGMEQEEAESEEQEEIEMGMGSGTIIGQNADELLILTSYHVVEDCSSLYVTFVNDANVDGYVKAADYDKDIAVVAIPLADIDEETMNSIKIATICPDEPEVGEGCLVIGNALGYGTSVTSGIVSKTDRQLYVEGRTLDVIQTDAAINFGNSGGCVVNAKGEIIGIAEAKNISGSVEGVCFAIPVARNMDLIQELMNEDEPFDAEAIKNTNMNGGFLGIRGRDVNADLSAEFEMPEGIYVSSVVPGSGAEEAGILSGDIIVGFGGEDITTMAELQYRLSSQEAGDTVSITVNRLVDGNYESMDFDVTLTDWIS